MTQYVGHDVSLKEMKLHVLDEAGNRVWRGRCATEPPAIAAAVRRYAPTAVRIGLETGPLTTWLWTARGSCNDLISSNNYIRTL
jgi:transposase